MEIGPAMPLDGVADARMGVAVVVRAGGSVADMERWHGAEDEIAVVVDRAVVREHQSVHQRREPSIEPKEASASTLTIQVGITGQHPTASLPPQREK